MINKLEEGQFYACNVECIIASLIFCLVWCQNKFPSFLVNCTARDVIQILCVGSVWLL